MSDEIDVSLEKVSAKIIVLTLNASNIAFYTHHFQNKYLFYFQGPRSSLKKGYVPYLRNITMLIKVIKRYMDTV